MVVKITQILLLSSFLLVIIILSGCTSCPSSCDDDIKCTEDYCSYETNYTCVHTPITPCEGNGICEQGEYGTLDCPDCDDNNKCTKDSLNYTTLECVHTPITPCEGNGICEQGEYGTLDCPDCDDNNKCTKDSLNYTTLECVHTPITPCCGNGKIEKGESCSSCPEDVKCYNGTKCCSGLCKNICTKDSDCISDDPAKEGKCINPNSCDAECEYTLLKTAIIKSGEYSVHGFKFDVNLEEYGNKIEYIDTSGNIEYLGAQDGKKLLKYRITVQCIEDDCNNFYSSSFILMDDEGNTYEAVCPVNWFGLCNNQDGIESMYYPLEGQKTSGILIFSIPRNVDYVYLIYKFSSYMDKPNNIEFVTELN